MFATAGLLAPLVDYATNTLFEQCCVYGSVSSLSVRARVYLRARLCVCVCVCVYASIFLLVCLLVCALLLVQDITPLCQVPFAEVSCMR